MWMFTPNTLSKRICKFFMQKLPIDSHFEVTRMRKNLVRLYTPNYIEKHPKFSILRIIVLVIMLTQHNIFYAQRYTGYGRGMSNDSFSFSSPGIKETIVLLLVAVTTLSLAGFLVKLNEKKEGKIPNVLTITTFILGLIGFGAALPLFYNYWYVVIIIAIGIALYGAFKER